MPQPWERDSVIGGTPQAAPRQQPVTREDPILSGPDPFKQGSERRANASEGRAAQSQAMEGQRLNITLGKEERDRKEWEATHNPDGTPKKPLEMVPVTASAGIQENLKVRKDIEAALNALQTRPQSVGFGTGMLGETFTNWNDPEGTATRAAIAAIGAKKIHDLSGAAVSMSEAPRFVPFVPTVTDPEDVSRAKLEKMLAETDSLLKEQLDYYSPTNGYRDYKTPEADAFRMPQNSAEAGLAPGAMSGPQEELYKGGATKTVASPVAAEYRRRLGAGEGVEQLTEYLRSAGVDFPEMEAMARGQVDFRKKYPRVPLDKYPVSINNEVPVGMMERVSAAARTSPVATYFQNAGDMLTGNNLDSAASLLGGNSEVARQNMNATNAANPKSAVLGQISGATMNALGAEAGLARMGVASGVARMTGANALAGAYEGFGGTDYNADGGQASFGDRVMGAGKGAAVNSLAAAGANAAFRGARAVTAPIGRAAVRTAGADGDVAIRQVGRALSEDGLTPRQAAAKISEAQSRGVPMSMADVGDNTRELLASVGRSRGEARSVVKTVIANRQRDQLERISSAVRRDLGPTANLREVGDELISRAKDEAGPLYQMAFEAPNLGVASPKVMPLLNRPSMRKAMVRANRIAAEEGRDPKKLGFDLDAQGEIKIVGKIPSWETLHYIKTGLDDVIESYRDKVTGKLVLDAEGRLINNTKNQLLSIFDHHNPTYLAARQAYAGPVQLNDAMQLGSKAFKMAPDDVAAQIKNLNPSEMEMYRLGLRKGLVDIIGDKGDYADKIKTLVGTPRSRAVLSKVLGGKPEFDRFMKTLSDEQELFRTYNAVSGNSETAGRRAFDETTTGENIASQAVDMLQAGKTGGLGGMAAAGAEKILKAGQLGAGKAGDQARADIARLLAESDPDTLAQIAKMANRANAKARLGQRKGAISAGKAGTVGGAIAGALGQGTSPGQ